MKLRTMLLMLMGGSVLLGSLGCQPVPGRKFKFHVDKDGNLEIEVDDTQVQPGPDKLDPNNEKQEETPKRRPLCVDGAIENASAMMEELPVPARQIDPSLWGPYWTDSDWQTHPMRIVAPLAVQFEMEQGWINDLLELEVVIQFTAPTELLLPDSVIYLQSYDEEGVFEIRDTLRAVCLLFRDNLEVVYLDLGALKLSYGADTIDCEMTAPGGTTYHFAAVDISTYLE